MEDNTKQIKMFFKVLLTIVILVELYFLVPMLHKNFEEYVNQLVDERIEKRTKELIEELNKQLNRR